MNATDTRVRNQNIMQLRGILPRVASLIPKDVKKLMTDKDYADFKRISYFVYNLLDEVKKKNFVCKSCLEDERAVKTKNKKAIQCDKCRAWDVQLYIYKEPKSNM